MPKRPADAPWASVVTPDVDLDRCARLWTPERVPLALPLAGIGERAIAYLVDATILIVLGVGALFVYNIWGDIERDVGGLSAFGTVVLGLALFGAAVLYDVLFEVLSDGRTPGKRMMGLRVLDARGRPPDLFTALLRNAVRLIDVLPFGYATGTIALFFTGTRRLGDLVADTLVATERAHAHDPLDVCRRVMAPGAPPLLAAAADQARSWSDEAQMRALEVVERTASMDLAFAGPVCLRVLRIIDEDLAAGVAEHEARALLARQCLAQASARQGFLGQVARIAQADAELRAALSRVVKGAGIAEVEAADLAVRRAGSELMRAARRGLPARHLEALSLALLEAERRRRPRAPVRAALSQFVLAEVPRAVFSERGLIARAGVVLVLGLLVGGAVAYADGALARALVGDEVARLVERGATWTNQIEEGNAYAAASLQIIFNNVGVGVRVFVLGLFGGVATILGLLSNGVQIGATFGYALRLGTADTLLRFIAAHGPVELTMIAVAGAAGLCLGRALVSPGSRTRLRALREEGSRGVRLVVAASLGFLCIGTVEGFVSPGRMFPWVVNASLGVILLGVFWLWVVAFGRTTTSAVATRAGASAG